MKKSVVFLLVPLMLLPILTIQVMAEQTAIGRSLTFAKKCHYIVFDLSTGRFVLYLEGEGRVTFRLRDSNVVIVLITEDHDVLTIDGTWWGYGYYFGLDKMTWMKGKEKITVEGSYGVLWNGYRDVVWLVLYAYMRA